MEGKAGHRTGCKVKLSNSIGSRKWVLKVFFFSLMSLMMFTEMGVDETSGFGGSSSKHKHALKSQNSKIYQKEN